MKNKDVTALYSQYVLPTYRQFSVCLVKGKGSRVWDIEGKEYLDFFPGWAVSGLGHCHPLVVNAVKHQATKMLHVPNHLLNVKQAELAREIVTSSFPGQVFFCNSGAEASEGALKFARRLGKKTGRYEIITMKNSFHGRTLAALTATGQARIQEGYEPLPGGFKYADFNDLASVEKLIGDQTIAVFLEPVLGEGGIQVATPEFMKGLRQLCDRHKLLLMVDEVQSGMGRTGRLFAFQNYGIEPDVMILAKALGGGIPIGALVVHERLKQDVFTPGSHGSTFGGNPIACAAALAVFRAIKKEGLLSHTLEMGKYLEEKMLQLKESYSIVKELRGLGLMRAMQLEIPGAPIVEAALAKGLLINCTQDTVLRIMPAMTITKKWIDKGFKILEEAFEEAAVKA